MGRLDFLYRMDLPHRAKSVYIYLLDRANKDGECWPAIPNMFIDYEALERDRKLQGAMLEVRRKFGSNALFKGMNLMEGATTLERNQQIGGHKA